MPVLGRTVSSWGDKSTSPWLDLAAGTAQCTPDRTSAARTSCSGCGRMFTGAASAARAPHQLREVSLVVLQKVAIEHKVGGQLHLAAGAGEWMQIAQGQRNASWAAARQRRARWLRWRRELDNWRCSRQVCTFNTAPPARATGHQPLCAGCPTPVSLCVPRPHSHPSQLPAGHSSQLSSLPLTSLAFFPTTQANTTLNPKPFPNNQAPHSSLGRKVSPHVSVPRDTRHAHTLARGRPFPTCCRLFWV